MNHQEHAAEAKKFAAQAHDVRIYTEQSNRLLLKAILSGTQAIYELLKEQR